jgi:hypothetical protein
MERGICDTHISGGHNQDNGGLFPGLATDVVYGGIVAARFRKVIPARISQDVAQPWFQFETHCHNRLT